MKIEDLEETAALAHLELDDKALAAAFPAFEQMLGFFAAMQAADVDTAAFSGASRTVPAAYFRPDAPDNPPNNFIATADTPANCAPMNEALLNRAGERDGQFVVIPNVL
jgi:aspartyl-tRNA(Asn)/glutamyl-tRNA(Gln) amidotransferase subunit C